MKIFSSANDNEVIRDLLPFVQPHEGVLRAQLHRTEDEKFNREVMRFTFSFSCSHCDVRRNVGYEVALHLNMRNLNSGAAGAVADKMAGHLRDFCEDVRRVPCMGIAERGAIAERVTGMLGLHGTMTREEFEAAWCLMESRERLDQAFLIARHLGFEPVDGLFQLPKEHPWHLDHRFDNGADGS